MRDRLLKVFATNHDIGSAHAMVPALQALKQSGCNVATFAVESAPAFRAFSSGSLNPVAPRDYGFNDCNAETVGKILEKEQPDLVFVGLSTWDDGSDKIALQSAIEKKISTAVIIESWPHLWLANYSKRDTPLYTQADRVLVFDDVSKQKMIDVGFSETRIVVTGNPANDDLANLREKKEEIRREVRSNLGIAEKSLLFTYVITNNLKPGKKDVDENDPRWLGFTETEIIEELLGAAKEANSFSPSRVIIRPKPGRDPKPIADFVKDLAPETLIIGFEYLDGRPLILASDMIVGTTTIMLQISAFLGVPAISYMPSLCRPDPQIANALGITAPLYQKGALRDLILSIAKDSTALDNLRRRFEKCTVYSNATANVVTALTARS